MRTGRIEETTEANRAAAESAGTSRAWGRMALVRGARPAGAVAALARLLSGPTGAARSAVLAQAGELVGEATGAERVGIYLAPSLVEPAPPAAEQKITAPTMPTAPPAPPAPSRATSGQGFILAASWARRGLALQGSPIGSRPVDASGRTRRPVVREIPCLGPSGPVALITLEGPAIGAAARREVDGMLEAIAGLVAGFLERDRLERELVALRVTRARGERLAQLGRVASSSAHDFNNVLTAILGYADLLELELASGQSGAPRARAPEARGQQELEEIRMAAARGAAIVEEILGFSRERPSGEAEVDLAQSIVRLEAMLHRVAGAQIELKSVVEPGLPRVRLDGERFERVLVNLVANARHAIDAARGDGTERSGRITITLERVRGARSSESGEDALRLVVRDDGCGMSADVERRVFEPFFTTRSALGGTGIGLADAADFARRAGGRIEVESREGQGTAIAILLPAV